MVDMDILVLAVPNTYKYVNQKRNVISHDYDNTVRLAHTLYGHSRMRLPYSLIVIGY